MINRDTVSNSKCRSTKPVTQSNCNTEPCLSLSLLAIWGDETTSAALINNRGDKVSVNWGQEGDVSGESQCSIQYENELFILGQVSLI